MMTASVWTGSSPRRRDCLRAKAARTPSRCYKPLPPGYETLRRAKHRVRSIEAEPRCRRLPQPVPGLPHSSRSPMTADGRALSAIGPGPQSAQRCIADPYATGSERSKRVERERTALPSGQAIRLSLGESGESALHQPTFAASCQRPRQKMSAEHSLWRSKKGL